MTVVLIALSAVVLVIAAGTALRKASRKCDRIITEERERTERGEGKPRGGGQL